MAKGVYGRIGLSDDIGGWIKSVSGTSDKQTGSGDGVSHNAPGKVIQTDAGGGARKSSGGSSANTAAVNIAAIDAILSGKVADYNERLKRAQAAYSADMKTAVSARDDALRQAYIAARQAGRVLPQELASRGAGGGLAAQEKRRIEANYQKNRRDAGRTYETRQVELHETLAAEESKVRGLIEKAKAQAQADRIKAMAKAAKG